MTQQSLAVIDLANGALAVPDYLANLPTIVGKIPTGDTRNRLGLKGREFHIVRGGVEEGVLDTKHADVIIVGAVPHISRLYYDRQYVEGEALAPACYSADGTTPAADVKQPQNDKCNTCQQNVKGSAVGGTGKGKACGFLRRLAVVLAGDDTWTVFQLDVKSKSMWNDGLPAQNRFSFQEYAKKLQANNIDAGLVITRLTFDPAESVSSLLFQPIGYVTQDQAARIVELVESGAVKPVLEVTMTTVDLSTEQGVAPPSEPAPVATAQDRPTLKPSTSATRPTPVQTAPTAAPVVARPVMKPVVRQPVQVAQPVEAQEEAMPEPLVINYPPKGRPQLPLNTKPAVVKQPVAQQVSDDVDALLAELEG